MCTAQYTEWKCSRCYKVYTEAAPLYETINHDPPSRGLDLMIIRGCDTRTGGECNKCYRPSHEASREPDHVEMIDISKEPPKPISILSKVAKIFRKS